MKIAIHVTSDSLPDETEIAKLIASQLVRLGIPIVRIWTAESADTIDQSAVASIDATRIITPITIIPPKLS